MARKPINNTELALAIEKKRLEADDRQILTRSQQELELASLAVSDLQKESPWSDEVCRLIFAPWYDRF